MTYFNTYDWSDSIYWNVKNQVTATSRRATQNITRFRRYIDGAYTESKDYYAGNDDEIGIGNGSDKYIMSGVDYKAWCDANGATPRLPESRPLVWVKNSKWWKISSTATLKTIDDNSTNWADYGQYWEAVITHTQAAKVEVGAGNAVEEPRLTYSTWVDEEQVGLVYSGSSCTVKIPSKHTMPTDVATTTLHQVGYLNDAEQYNVVPSIELKDFLTKYQLDEGSPLGMRPIEAYNGGVNTQKYYTTNEARAIIQDVINFVNGLGDCTLVWSMAGAHYHERTCEAEKTCTPYTAWASITTTLYTDSSKSYRSISFADSKTITGRIKKYSCNYSSHVVNIGDPYTTEDGYTYDAISTIEGTHTISGYSKEIETTSLLAGAPTMWKHKDAAGIKDVIEANGYTEQDDINLQYYITTVLRQLYQVVEMPAEHSYHVYLDKATLLTVLGNMYESARKLDDEYEGHLSEVVKTTATGKLLKDAGYLESIMNTSDVNSLDHMYLSFRISLQDKINRFNDGDIANEADEIADLLDRKNIWEYLNVYTYTYHTTAIVGEDDEWVPVSYQVPIAYLPNWTKLQKGSNQTASAVMSAMMKIDNHIHVPKKSTWVKVRMAVVTAVITAIIIVVACSNPVTCPSTSTLVLTAIAMISGIAAAATGSDTWQKIGQAASIASITQAFAQPGMTFGKFVSQQGLQIGMQFAQMGIAHRHQGEMDAIQKKIDSTNEELHEIQELETIVEAREKVKRYITTDHHTDRYSMEYDRIYNIKYV